MKVVIYTNRGKKKKFISEADAEKQREELVRFCKRKNYQVVGEFISQQQENEPDEMLEKIKKLLADKSITGVIISDYASISEKLNEVMAFQDFVQRSEGQLICSKLDNERTVRVFERKEQGK